MKLQLQTRNPEVLSGVYAGFDNLQKYKTSGDTESLQRAVAHLEKATSLDPHYFPAVYYRAISQDLSGKSSVAVGSLDEIRTGLEKLRLPAVSEADNLRISALLPEVTFNLGVAYYHLYTGDNIDKAIELFETVRNSNSATPAIRVLATANLAQGWAQKIIQKDVANPEFGRIEDAFQKARKLAKSVEESSMRDSTIDDRTRLELNWRLENALGCADMFRSDWPVPDGHPISHPTDLLNSALNHFEEADRLSPRNWAIFCNLGSAWMRKGHWSRIWKTGSSEEAFEKGRGYLMEVVDNLRKDYGFGYYELGRLHRLRGDFSQAIRFFERALEIPIADRNVSDKTVLRELERARDSSEVFP